MFRRFAPLWFVASVASATHHIARLREANDQQTKPAAAVAVAEAAAAAAATAPGEGLRGRALDVANCNKVRCAGRLHSQPVLHKRGGVQQRRGLRALFLDRGPRRLVLKDSDEVISERLGSDGDNSENPDAGSNWRSSTTSSTPKPNTLTDQLGVHINSTSDGETLLVTVLGNGSVILLLALLFSSLRRNYPIVYSRIDPSSVPFQPSPEFLGWLWASRSVPADQIEQRVGLDCGMLIEFCNFGMRVAVCLGIPLCLLLSPAYRILGENDKGWMIQYSVHNLESGDDAFLAVGIVVWAVVLVADRMIWTAQRSFVERRIAWLQRLPKPRATTLLVTDIPSEYRSDARLMEYYSRLFPGGAIERVYVAKHIPRLSGLVGDLQATERRLLELKHEAHVTQGDGRLRHSSAKDTVEYQTNVREDYAKMVEEEQKVIVADCQNPGTRIFGSEGFVTFKSRRDSEMALRLQLEPDGSVFNMQSPPDPSDVRYEDLLVDPESRMSLQIAGYFSLAAIFFGFIPIVTLLSAFINIEVLDDIEFVGWILENSPILQSVLEGVIASLAISITLGLLPGAFLGIFNNFFALRSSHVSQIHVQRSYFWFQVIFVVLVTSVGSSLWDSVNDLLDMGLYDVMGELGSTLPNTSSFYMYYTVVQCPLNVLQLTRYVILLKFLALRVVMEVEDAKALVEPGDQGFNGIGARSARLTLILVIGLVFCTISPFILVLTFFFFLVCRWVYGYLLVFVEEVQVDLGGVFWCQQLNHLQHGVFLYIFTMSGFLFAEAPDGYAGVIALLSSVYMYSSYRRFGQEILWQTLPFHNVVEGCEKLDAESMPQGVQYVQPELRGVF